MPGDPLQLVSPNDPFEVQAATHNAFVQAARYVFDQGPGFRAVSANRLEPETIWVRNDSGADRSRFEVLTLGDPLVLPTTNLTQFLSGAIAFKGELAGAPGSGRWVILDQPLAGGVIGRAYATGVCPVRLTVLDTDHTFADVVAGEPQLRSAKAGAAEILWKETGTGADKWAIVRFGGARPALWGKLNEAADAWEDVPVTIHNGLPGVTTGDQAETATEEVVIGHMPEISLPSGARVRLAITGGFPGSLFDIQPYGCATEEEP